jgi:hypothetical protein
LSLLVVVTRLLLTSCGWALAVVERDGLVVVHQPYLIYAQTLVVGGRAWERKNKFEYDSE